MSRPPDGRDAVTVVASARSPSRSVLFSCMFTVLVGRVAGCQTPVPFHSLESRGPDQDHIAMDQGQQRNTPDREAETNNNKLASNNERVKHDSFLSPSIFVEGAKGDRPWTMDHGRFCSHHLYPDFLAARG